MAARSSKALIQRRVVCIFMRLSGVSREEKADVI
jgi:hypothetical protein